MKLDLKNPVQGLYRMTKTVMHRKPDGRAARGWDSREGTPEGTLVRVTVWKPPFHADEYEGLSPERVEAIRKAWEARGPEIDLGLPGRYHFPSDVRVDLRHDEPTAATLAEIVDALELVGDGQGLLDQIDPKCRNWEDILALMIDRGDVHIDAVKQAYKAYWAKVDEE